MDYMLKVRGGGGHLHEAGWLHRHRWEGRSHRGGGCVHIGSYAGYDIVPVAGSCEERHDDKGI